MTTVTRILEKRDSAALYKFIIVEHFASVKMLHENSLDTFYLDEGSINGLAIGTFDERGRLVSVLLTSFEFSSGIVVTRGIYGKLGEHTIDALDLLSVECIKRDAIDLVFVMHEDKLEEFMSYHEMSSLGKQKPFINMTLPKGLRPKNKQVWEEFLGKNIPYDNLAIFRITVKT